MVSFLAPARGGIQPINGRAGGIIEDMITAKKGVPGRDIVINPINKIISTTQIIMPAVSCDPQSATQRTLGQIKVTIEDIITNNIKQTVQQTIEQNAEIKQIENKLEELKQSQELSVSQFQEMEILEIDKANQIKAATIAAISAVSRAMPEAVKIANIAGNNVKMIGGVAAHLEAPIGTAINLGRYGAVGETITVKVVEVVSQTCTFG